MLNFQYSFIKPIAKSNKIDRFVYKSIELLTNIIYPIYIKIIPIKNKKIEKDTIVSLTSYPKRIKGLYYTLQSIMRQNTRSEKIILWLSSDEFPNRELDIPKRIIKLKKYGLTIEFCENIRSYKKIIYTAKKYKNKIIITADDDSLYPEKWLKELIDVYYKNNEQYIVCHRAHQLLIKNKKLIPYKKWNKFSPDIIGPSNDLVAIGVGGILYPKRFFSGIDLDSKIYMKLAPTTDDIWLKVCALIKNTKIIKVRSNSKELFNVLKSQKTRLSKVNVEENDRNIEAFNKLLTYYKVDITRIIK